MLDVTFAITEGPDNFLGPPSDPPNFPLTHSAITADSGGLLGLKGDVTEVF